MIEEIGPKKMLRRKRICVYTHLFPVRSETFIREHVLGLVRRGHRVTVLARESGGDISGSELGAIDQEGIERVYLGSFVSFSTKLTDVLNGLRAFFLVVRYPRLFRIFRSTSPWTTRELVIACEAARFISSGRFDLVHVHYGDLAARLRLVGAGFSGFPPMVVTWHGYDVNAKPRVLGGSAYRELFSSGAVHTVGSNFIRQRLIALGAREEAVARVPMGVDLARFSYVERRRDERDPFKILSVGRLEDVKGHAFLIEAVRRLKAEQIPVLLRIAGDGPLKAVLQAQIETSEVADRVELLGMVDADCVAREMRDAHLFALTGVETASGKVESQGVVFAEAQASGLPVVASRVGGIPESVIAGETGFLCPPADVDEIVRVIRLFARDPDMARRFGRRGRSFVENNFSHEGMMSNFDELYQCPRGE